MRTQKSFKIASQATLLPNMCMYSVMTCRLLAYTELCLIGPIEPAMAADYNGNLCKNIPGKIASFIT